MPARNVRAYIAKSENKDYNPYMNKDLCIYFTSDTHGYFSAVDYAKNEAAATGLACCAAGFRRDGNSLVIDGGDTLQGSPFTYWLHKQGRGEHSLPARLMNLAGYQFVTLGNHDFNYGRSTLEQYLRELDATCLCANVEGLERVKKTAIVTLANELRVGLTGITTQFINVWEKPENLVGISITEPLPAAEKALRELKAAGVDVTVCIYHGGFENDLASGELLSDTGENQAWRLCHALDFDIVLTGHQHMPLENACVAGSFTCQTPDKAKAYIRMDVTVGETVSAASRLCEPQAEPLPAMAEALLEADAATAAWLDTPVGHLDTTLRPDTPLRMAAEGSFIANFFNQVQLEASGAEISATCLGNEVRGFEENVTVRDIVATYIYPNTLITLQVDRSVLKEALERSAEYFDLDARGGLCVSDRFLKPKVEHYNFDYFSGLEVTVDVRRPLGERVLSIRFEGEELQEDRKLSLCLNNYRATGTGGYGCYLRCPVLRQQPNEIVEMIMDYVLRHREICVDRTRWLTVLHGREGEE